MLARSRVTTRATIENVVAASRPDAPNAEPFVCGEVSSTDGAGGAAATYKRFIYSGVGLADIEGMAEPWDQAGSFDAKWQKLCSAAVAAGQAVQVEVASKVAAGATQPVLGLKELNDLAESVRGFQPNDTFDAPPNQPPLAGRRFAVTLSPSQAGPNKGCSGSPTWGFDAGKSEFAVDAYPTMTFPLLISPRDSLPESAATSGKISSVVVTCRRPPDTATTASNAFGRTVTVQQIKESTVSLSTPDFIGSTTKPYWSKNVEGDAARQLASAIRVRVTGVLGEWKQGQVVACYKSHTQPTMDLPFEITENGCMFKTQSVHLDFIDSRTQAVLYSFE